jgi:spore germination cell wall hydrolase CwlJ-like protein
MKTKTNKIYKTFAVVLVLALLISCVKSIVYSTVVESEPEVYASAKEANPTILDNDVIKTSCAVYEKNNMKLKNKKETPKTEEVIIETEESEKETIKTEEETPKTEEVIIETEENVEDNNVSNTYSEYDIYLLAKIIMAEAEGESQRCKELVGQVIINRVNSSKFPNSVYDVIFDGIQFSPTFNGRWERVEPNQDCYDAAYKVINSPEPLTNATYFEACKGESWHSRNLTLVIELEEDNTRFYIE